MCTRVGGHNTAEEVVNNSDQPRKNRQIASGSLSPTNVLVPLPVVRQHINRDAQ